MDKRAKLIKLSRVSKNMAVRLQIQKYLQADMLQILQIGTILRYKNIKTLVKKYHTGVYTTVFLRTTFPKRIHTFSKLMIFI